MVDILPEISGVEFDGAWSRRVEAPIDGGSRIVLSCQSAMAPGTLCGGWRIVRTVGSRITHLTPIQGFCAETGGTIALFGATWLGIPVSTTHTVTGSIIGVGAARRVSAVRWGVTHNIAVAWVVTLPTSALVAAGCYRLATLFLP
jgi:PiT family inorganic phosphate transporter